MNKQEQQAIINTEVTTKTADDSITPTDVGSNMEANLDVVRPFNELRFRLSVSGGAPTIVEERNDFVSDGSPTIFEYTIPSNGKLRIAPIAPATNPFTEPESHVETTAIFDAGIVYSVVPAFFLVIVLDINFKRQTDGDQSITPNFSNQRIIIKKYE
ncbi:MAG: hypothetical protein AB8F74_19565 [Saprospiraceae bacterium]